MAAPLRRGHPALPVPAEAVAKGLPEAFAARAVIVVVAASADDDDGPAEYAEDEPEDPGVPVGELVAQCVGDHDREERQDCGQDRVE